MEPYLCISQLNDFVFCPRSIYFHNIYQDNYSDKVYHKTWQKKGQAAHRAIDEQHYSSQKHILQSLTIYSEKYRLLGKIDLLDTKKQELTERKYSVSAIYDGFRYQVYAQYLALLEMGYEVQKIRIYSKKDNKSYPIPLPGKEQIAEFEQLLQQIRSFSLLADFSQNPEKCRNCIYNPLCDHYKEI